MKELDLYLKLKKCKFRVTKVDFLRLILWPGEIAMDQTIWDCGLAHPNKSQRCQVLLGICQLLQKIYWRLLKYCMTPHQPYKKEQRVELDPHLSRGLWPTKRRILQTTSPHPTWPKQTICHCHWCLQGCLWKNPPPSRLEWRMAPLLLSFSNIFPHRTKLWHLLSWTPCSNKRTEDMETLPARIPFSSKSLHQS